MSLPYMGSCVGWSIANVNDLIDMIDNCIDLTRRTFLKHVDREELLNLEHGLGYVQNPSYGMTMASDYHVSYHRGKYRGRTAYFFKQSAIEYVFCEGEL